MPRSSSSANGKGKGSESRRKRGRINNHAGPRQTASGCRQQAPSRRRSTTDHSKLTWGSCSSRRRTAAAAAAVSEGGEGNVLLTFKPSEVEVACKPGEVALEVASRCSGMPEDSRNPFCRDGGCYNCEVEVVEADELGIVDNLVRACMFKIPKGAKKLTLIQMNSEEAFEDML
ncbi:unnamed protein product [Pylaiella littoralis]